MATKEEYKKYLKSKAGSLVCYVCRKAVINKNDIQSLVQICQFPAQPIKSNRVLIEQTKIVIHKDCFLQVAGSEYYFEVGNGII